MRPRFKRQIVRGAPFLAHGRLFVPEARITTLVAGTATMRNRGTSLAGFRIARIRPTALIEVRPDGERRRPIDDATARSLLAMAMAAAVLPFILKAAAGWMSRR